MLQVLLAIALSSGPLSAQRGVVVDQTGLPLPGAHVEVHRGDRVVASFDTGLDGGFELGIDAVRALVDESRAARAK